MSVPELTAEDAASLFIQNHSVVVTAMAASEPGQFFNMASEFFETRNQVIVYCANPSKPYEIFRRPELLGSLELRPLFLTSNVRDHQSMPHVHYVPQHLSSWSRNIIDQHHNIDVFWGSCSLPDRRGFVSLGPGVCYESEILKKSGKIILEVNPNIPFTHGATAIPSSIVDAFVHSDLELPEYKTQKPDATDQKIACYVADMIADGSTIQLGIGSIPDALTSELRHKKDLGIHTEMINNSVQNLVEWGVVNGRYKSIWPDRVVGSFAYGNKSLYEFIHQNPMVEFHPASVIVDPYRIGRNHRMVSVNSAVEIDLTGQVCSESVGHLELSGIGGAFDTHTGAQRSGFGTGIIALKSKTKTGISKIVSELKPGAKVSISRNDIDTVITEYGVARLKGQSVAERAKRLIHISHPEDQDFLSSEAKKHGYI